MVANNQQIVSFHPAGLQSLTVRHDSATFLVKILSEKDGFDTDFIGKIFVTKHGKSQEFKGVVLPIQFLANSSQK